LDGPLPKLCTAVTLSHQDGHHSAVALLLKDCRNWIKATQVNIFEKFQGSEVKAFAVYYTKYILHSQICDLFVIANNQFGFPVLVSYNFDISDG
jgi:hypothetical protein